MPLNDITIRIGAEAKGVDGVFQRIEKRMSATASRMQSIGTKMSLAVTAPLAVIGKSAIDLSVEVEESENLFNVSMGKMAGQAREFSKEVERAMGINAFSVRKNIGVIQAMAKGMGFADEAAFSLAQSIELLKNDLSSFFNLKTEEAFQKLQAGIVGEIEPLRRLGILVDEQTVRQKLLDRGLIKSGQDLSQMQKVLGRYLAILDQTTDAQGDMVRTLFSTANQQRILNERWEKAKKLIGDDLKPLYAGVVFVLRQVIDKFIALEEPTRKNIVKMAGLAASLGLVFLTLGTGLKIITLFASKFVLFSGAIAAAAAVSYVLWKNWDEIQPKLSNIWNTLKEGVQDLGKSMIDSMLEVASSWDGTLPGLVKTMQTFWESKLKPYIENTLVPQLKDAMNRAWNEVPDSWKPLLERLFKLVRSWWDSVFDLVSGVADFIFLSLRDAWKGLEGLWNADLTTIEKAVKDWWSKGLRAFIDKSVIPFIEDTAGAAWDALPNKWKAALTPAKDTVVKVWNLVKKATNDLLDLVGSTVAVMWEGVKAVWNLEFNNLENAVKRWWKDVRKVLDDAIKFIEITVAAAWDALPPKWKSKLGELKNAVEDWWNNGVKPLLDPVLNLIEDTVGLAWTGIEALWTGDFSRIKIAAIKFKNSLLNVIRRIPAFVEKTLKVIWAALPPAWKAKLTELATTVRTKIDEIKGVLTGLKDQISDTIGSAWDGMKKSWSNALKGGKQAVTEWWADLKSWWENNVNAFFTGWLDWFKEKFENIGSTIKNIFAGKFGFEETKLPEVDVGKGVENAQAVNQELTAMLANLRHIQATMQQTQAAALDPKTNFFKKLQELNELIEFSTTSLNRSVERNASVGGNPRSKHLEFLAADAVVKNMEDPSVRARFAKAARELGLVAVDEFDHIHLQLSTSTRDKLNKALMVWKEIVPKIINAQKEMSGKVSGDTKKLFDEVVSIYEQLAETLVGNSVIPDMNEAIVKNFEETGEKVVDVSKSTGKAIEQANESSMGSVIAKLKSQLADVTSAFKQGFKNALGDTAFNQEEFEKFMERMNKLSDDLAKQFALLGDATDEKIKNAVEALDEKIRVVTESAKVFGDTSDLVSDKLGLTKQAIVNLIEQGVDPADPRMKELIDRFRELDQQLRVQEGFKVIGQTVSDSMSSMVDGVLRGTQTMSDAFRNMVRNILLSLANKALTNAINNIFSSIGNAITSSSGGGGFLGTLSSLIGSVFGGGRQHGGRVNPGKVFAVNEAGLPELFVPDTPGKVVPLGQMAAAGGGANVQVNIINNTNAAVQQRRRTEGGLEIVDVTISEAIRRDLRTNGPISQELATKYGLNRQGVAR